MPQRNYVRIDRVQIVPRMQLDSISHYTLTSCQRSSIFKTPDARFFHSDFLSKSLYKCNMILWISSELMKDSVFSHNVKKTQTDSKLPHRWKHFLIQWNFLCQQPWRSSDWWSVRDGLVSTGNVMLSPDEQIHCVWTWHGPNICLWSGLIMWAAAGRTTCPHVSTWDWWRCCWLFHLFCMMGPNIIKIN